MDDLREKIARAVDGELDTQEMVLADPLTLRRLKADRIARVAFSTIEAAGLVVVPREPTPAMCKAALSALTNCTVDEPKAAAWDAMQAYRAMIAASKPRETE